MKKLRGKLLDRESVAREIDAFENRSNAGELIIFDNRTAGFGLRLRRSGHHVWIFQYRAHGQQRRVTIGDVARLNPNRARGEAERIYSDAKLGGDPQQKKLLELAKAKRTLAWAIERYLEERKPALRPNSYAELRRYLHQHWANFHRVPITKIDTDAIDARLGVTAEARGKISAMHGRIALSSLFAFAMRKGWCGVNPVINANNPGAGAEPRERVLNDDELRQVWNACADDDYGRIVQLLILTGQRRQEIGSMTWDELNPKTGAWTIPGARTKNKRTHSIPLPAAAWTIIKQVPRRHQIPYLFGRDHGFVSWSLHKSLLDERCKIAPWVVHDLRRTAASGMQRLKIRTEAIEKALNHTSGVFRGVAGIYQRDPMTEEVRDALEQWSHAVLAVVSGKGFPRERKSGPAT